MHIRASDASSRGVIRFISASIAGVVPPLLALRGQRAACRVSVSLPSICLSPSFILPSSTTLSPSLFASIHPLCCRCWHSLCSILIFYFQTILFSFVCHFLFLFVSPYIVCTTWTHPTPSSTATTATDRSVNQGGVRKITWAGEIVMLQQSGHLTSFSEMCAIVMCFKQVTHR